MKSRAEMARTIDAAWMALARQANSYGMGSVSLEDCLVASEAVERAHRRMGRGLQTAPYRLSVSTVARLFVLRFVHAGAKPPKNWEQAASVRKDALLCYALRGQLKADGRMALAFPSGTFLSIDYAADVAGGA